MNKQEKNKKLTLNFFPRILIYTLFVCWINVSHAGIITVNTTADNTIADSETTLREAILAANTTGETDTINFDIAGVGPHTIQPLTALPDITFPVYIDGSSQPGADCDVWPFVLIIELNGDLINSNGLVLGPDSDESTVKGLVINGFKNGISIEGSNDHTIICNYIGTDVTGTNGIKNTIAGINLDNADNIQIGGTESKYRNLISGNNYAIDISSANNSNIQGNYFGTDPSGQNPIPNEYSTIEISGGNHITIGGNEPAAGNLFAYGLDDVISVSPIGVDMSHLLIGYNRFIENEYKSIYLGPFRGKMSHTQIIYNDILDNGGDGIHLGSRSLLESTLIQGNIINRNGGEGIALISRSSRILSINIIDNTISNNTNGIYFHSHSAQNQNTIISGNSIYENSENGIMSHEYNPDFLVGATFTQNAIYDNQGLGIDLLNNGVSPNDAQDLDEGPNGLQNFPILTSALRNGNQITVTGTFNSVPNTSNFTIEFFASTENDPSGHGEGEVYLKSVFVDTDVNGDASFSANLLLNTAENVYITATATHPDGSTSEFSQAIQTQITGCYVVTNTNDSGEGSLRQAIVDANAHPNLDANTPDTIKFDIPGTGPFTIQPNTRFDEITDAVIIDALTQSGAHANAWPPQLMIELDGSNAESNGSSFLLGAGSSGSTIRGFAINRWKFVGLFIQDSDEHIIESNFIGTDITGTIALPNEGNGLSIRNGHNNRIGGTEIGQRNLLSGNTRAGVWIGNASNNVVLGNYIGTDVLGQNPLRNSTGVYAEAGMDNKIGGDNNGENLIAHNENGIIIISYSGNSVRTEISHNTITNNSEAGIYVTPLLGAITDFHIHHNTLSNNSTGIQFYNEVVQMVVGKIEENVIRANNGVGIQMDALNSSDLTTVEFSKNAIFNNQGLGIDLNANGVTTNDDQDDDEGHNGLQNFPILDMVNLSGTNLNVTGSFNSTPNVQNYRIEFFANSTVDPSGHGEGEIYLGFANVDTDANGDATVSFSVNTNQVATGNYISATATDPNGNTSEFSGAIMVENSCSISSIVAVIQTACDPWFNTYTQTLEITHTGAPATGQLSVNGQLFEIGASPQTIVLTDLISDGQAVDVIAFFMDEPECILEETALFTAPVDCSIPCSILNVTAGTAYNCEPNSDTYERDLILEYEGTNLTGNILVEINGGSPIAYPIEHQSPQIITLSGLPSNDQWVDVKVYFSDESACTWEEAQFFQNPQNCGDNPSGDCDITDLEVGEQICHTEEGTYSQELILTYTDAPSSGSILVKVNNQSDWISFPITNSPQNLILTDLEPNGEMVDIFVKFSDDNGCTYSANSLFTAPETCEEPDENDGEVLFVVKDANDLHSGDEQVKARLENLGYTVVVKSETPVQTTDADDKILVLISNTVSSGAINTKFTEVSVPVICYEALLYDDLGMTASANGIDYGQDSNELTIDIDNPSHQLAAGLNGESQVYTSSGTIIWGNPNNNAIKVASTQGWYGGQSAIFAYEANSDMVSGAAPARRVGLFFKASQVSKLNANGWALFDEAVCWATGCISESQNRFAAPNTQLKAFPNPFKQTLSLEWEGTTQEVQLSIRNLLGQQVMNRNVYLNHGLQLSLSHLPTGLYILQLKGDGVYEKIKVVKE